MSNGNGAGTSGVAILPKTTIRPLAIVDIDNRFESAQKLSEQLNQLGLEHVMLSVADAELEGISIDELKGYEVDDKIFDSNGLKPIGGTNKQPSIKRKKKTKKTHRKK